MAGFDLDDIAKHYAKMSDSDIIRIATQEAKGLRPEVFGIIENEVAKRNLNADIMKGAAAQKKKYTVGELEKYAEQLRNIACPICNQTQKKLNGTVLYTVKSFLIVSTFSKKPLIACPDCLDKKNNDSITSTMLLGWWGIPWGILRTPFYIYNNIKIKKENHSQKANGTLLSYTLANIGEIETYFENPMQLQKIITVKN
ncbi:MAG: hypothetical protein PSV16_03515 [Flavobacterium sp.]|nr:hypothetical protein [Flavobacterium sp.]